MRTWLPNELEEVSCDYCGSNEVLGSYMRADGMRVVECSVCGLAYLNPRPKARFIELLYGEDYFDGSAVDRGEGGLRVHSVNAKSAVRAEYKINTRPLELMRELHGETLGKNILEIGCATGDLLSLIAKDGAGTYGIEISKFASQIARERGLNVFNGTLDDFLLTNNKTFDVVMAFEVIEHVLSPTSFMRDAAKLIKDHGLLLISTPNYACAQRYGREWYGFNYSYEHLYFYSIDVLKRMAYKAGLRLKYWETSAFQGGPVKQENCFSRQVSRGRRASTLIDKYGFSGGIMRFINRVQMYKPYGSGHTLVAVFEKIEK